MVLNDTTYFFYVDCTSSSRKKRSAMTQTQLVTLTSINVENGAESSGESDQGRRFALIHYNCDMNSHYM